MTKHGVLRLAGWMLALISLASRSGAQALDVGSDGSDGPFVFVQDTGPGAQANTMTIDLGLAASGLDGMGQPIRWQTPSPVAGRGVYDASIWCVVLKYTSVNVPSGKTVKFTNHPSRAALVWLVQGSADIQGTIELSGAGAFSGRGEPGPGGFRGGLASAGFNISAAHGPGAGTTPGSSACNASCYGSAACKPLVGGSGVNAVGGGGAFLFAVSVDASFGALGRIFSTSGSGGVIRVVANRIVRAYPQGSSGFNVTILGRIRLEANVFEGDGTLVGVPSPVTGPPSSLLPDATTPVVEVVAIDPPVGGSVTAPPDPRARTDPSSADVLIPAPGTVTVRLQARNVPVGRTCVLRVLNVIGNATPYTSTPLAGTQALSTASVQVPLTAGVYAIQAQVIL